MYSKVIQTYIYITYINSHLSSKSAMVPAAAAAKSLQSCPILCDPIDGSPPRHLRPWDSPGKNTGVGCHFLLQCMKVKSESEVTQSCPTLCDPMDCSLPGSSVHGIFQARVLEWGATAFSQWSLRYLHKIRTSTETNSEGKSPWGRRVNIYDHLQSQHFKRGNTENQVSDSEQKGTD